MVRALTDKEEHDFRFITDSDSNTALVQVVYQGQETAAICAINEEDGEYNIIPLALMITPEIFNQIEKPV